MDTDGAAAQSLSDGSKHGTTDSVILFVLGMLAFTVALPPEFIGLQTRFAVFAQEMLRNGPSFFPTVYGRPYPDYPAASTFLIYLASLPFGRVTVFSAVLPSAIASALVLVLTYRIGALRSRRWGLAAAMFAAATAEFMGDARNTTLDLYTTLATILSFYIVYSAGQLGRSGRLWLLPLAWILGFAFRGPIGLVIPVAVVCGYYLWNAQFKQLILAGAAGAVVLGLCMKGLLAAAAVQGGQALAQSVLSSQVTGRMDDRGGGFSYYWLRCLTSYALSYPIAILIVASRFRDIVRKTTREDKLLGSLAAWVLIVLIGMSIPSAKHIRYVLPIVPAASLIAAYLFVDASPKGVLLTTRRLFEWVCSGPLLPIGLAVAALILLGLTRRMNYAGVLAAAVLLAVISRRLLHQPLRSLGVCAAAFVIATAGITDWINYDLEKTRPFVRQVEALQKDHPGDIVFLGMGPDQEDVKFVANASRPIEPRFAASFDELKQWQGGRYIVTDEDVFATLPSDIRGRIHVLLRGKIGHVGCVVFAIDQN